MMVEEEYGGIPRREIKWFPRIDQDLCTQCGVCVEFCHKGVFAAKDRTEVVRPHSCVVGCKGCESQCPSGAISFPTLRDLRAMLRKLREEYSN
jgi:NAD-dependent dihydropyrimidine dehydrogenase PreA subunit